MRYDNRRILIISDTHFPYHHHDAIPFLNAMHRKYDFTRIIHVGDEIDLHSASFHDKDPNLYGASHELEKAIGELRKLYALFPKVEIMESNHGALYKRKIKHHGLPESILRSSREILEAPKGWVWKEDVLIKLPNGQLVYVCHGKSSNALAMSKQLGMCTVNGHFHTQFGIQKWSTPFTTNWAMVVGCLIDKNSRAYGYQKNEVMKPVIGCGMIIDSQPRLELMQVGSDGRWLKKLS